ncbi:hypothetical protein BQ8420_25855 [Nocardiopsis sp. JB363]|nr:hypothetical protein BQ8420_25855 [Nocardiopsis sp. JB363]
MAAPAFGYRRRWYGGNRYYDDGHGYAPRRRGGGIASAIGCLAFAVVALVVVIAIAVL